MLGGNDTINAGGGNDLAYGGSGSDSLDGGAGTDRLYGEEGNDSLLGSGGTDSLYGGGGTDSLYGGAGNDSLGGGLGNDLLDGGDNNDRLSGEAGDDTLLGGTGLDSLFGGSGDDSLDGGDSNDSLDGGSGDDTVQGGLGDDTILGGGGSDTLFGGDGNDSIFGDLTATATAQDEALRWSLAGADEANIANGITQTTGQMTVSVSFGKTALTSTQTLETTDTVFIGTGEPMSATSNLSLTGAGNGTTSTTYIDFAAAPGSGVTDEVEDIQFRINDIDTGGWQDIVTVNAYDADGNPVAVTLTPSGNDAVSGNTITAGPTSDSASSAQGSVLVTIAGPAARIEIVYNNISTVSQSLWVSNIHFTTIPQVGGNDSLIGGIGDDTLDGGIGDDTLDGGIGDDTLDGGLGADQMSGGLGSDRFVGLGVGDVVDGGEDTPSSETDVLDLFGSGWSKATTNILYAGGNDEAGTVQFLDGLGNVIGTLSFSNIEQVIPCFTPGTRIDTLEGPVAVEAVRPGDRVLTRDSGYRTVCWAGRRDLGLAEVLAQPAFRPVLIRAGALGPGCPDRDMAVSPQHRMLVCGARAELVAGEREVLAAALHLVGRPGISRAPAGPVSYIHLMCDAHEILRADGAWSESFQPGQASLGGLDPGPRDELLALFPSLASGQAFPAARQTLKAHEAKVVAGG
jgi:hypothetical protein